MRFATVRVIQRECRVRFKYVSSSMRGATLANFACAATVAALVGMGFPETARKS